MYRQLRVSYFLRVLSVIGFLTIMTGATAAPRYNVNLSISGLSGQDALLAFDLVDGDGMINNTAVITNFFTDGSLQPGLNINQGGAAGDLPGLLTITDADFFNESAEGITLGSKLSYQLSLTNNYAGGIPDEYSFYVLNASGMAPIVHTSDPTGADALFTLDQYGSDGSNLTVYRALTDGVSLTVVPVVPEFGMLSWIGSLLVIGGAYVSIRKRNRHSGLSRRPA